MRVSDILATKRPFFCFSLFSVDYSPSFFFLLFIKPLMMPRNSKQVVPLRYWPAQPLARCGGRPLDTLLWCARRKSRILSTVFRSDTTRYPGLQRLLLYLTLVVVTWFVFVHLWPVRTFTPRLVVALYVEVLHCFLFFGLVLFLRLRATMNSLLPRVKHLYNILYSFGLAFCGTWATHAKMGSLLGNSMRILTIHCVRYTRP